MARTTDSEEEPRASGASPPAGAGVRPRGRLVRGVPRPLRWIARGCLSLLLAGLLYLGAAEVGMRLCVHAEADPEAGEIDVYLVSNGAHVDLWVPTTRPERDWRTWLPPELPLAPRGYVAFGWGDAEFFRRVPTWGDLTPGIALRGALWPTPAAMHVRWFWSPPYVGDHVHRLRIGSERYVDLVRFIESGFALDAAGRPALLDVAGNADNDRFFAGAGRYHLFATCNVWTNEAVKAMGQKAALWAPLERGVRFHLPRNRGQPPAR